MIVPDANLLLYAYDSTSKFHDASVLWWERCISGRETVGLTRPAIFAFIRISTNARVFDRPMTIAESIGHVYTWLDRPVTRLLDPDTDHIRTVADLLETAGATAGNLVTDAQIASIAKSYRAVVHTADRDFLRFPDISVYYPLDAQ